MTERICWYVNWLIDLLDGNYLRRRVRRTYIPDSCLFAGTWSRRPRRGKVLGHDLSATAEPRIARVPRQRRSNIRPIREQQFADACKSARFPKFASLLKTCVYVRFCRLVCRKRRLHSWRCQSLLSKERVVSKLLEVSLHSCIQAVRLDSKNHQVVQEI